MWKLFIDDERDPVTNDWVIARSSEQAKQLCIMIGNCPNEIAFDHDLGGDDTSIKFIHWLINAILDERIVLPDDFKFSVHSQNPVGVENIKSLMNSIINYAKGE